MIYANLMKKTICYKRSNVKLIKQKIATISQCQMNRQTDRQLTTALKISYYFIINSKQSNLPQLFHNIVEYASQIERPKDIFLSTQHFSNPQSIQFVITSLLKRFPSTPKQVSEKEKPDSYTLIPWYVTAGHSKSAVRLN